LPINGNSAQYELARRAHDTLGRQRTICLL
jgi:hypothetical protein